MKIWTFVSTAVLAIAAASHLAAAQTGDKMAKPMGMAKSYTGCVAAGTAPGSFMLAHATMDMAMAKDAMAKDSMKKDTMAKDAMGKDTAMAIESKSVDLSKHVGQKVTVTGMEAPTGMAKPDAMGKATPMFTVTAVKLIASSCGM